MYPDEVALSDFDKEGEASVRVDELEGSPADVGLDFEDLFQRYQSLVFHLAYRVLGDREEALDVSQEVFLIVYRELGRFRGESSLRTWIYRIAINRASNRCRWWNRLRRRGTISLEGHLGGNGHGGLIDTLESGETSPEEMAMMREERAQLERSLAKLPLPQRVALVLRDVEGLSYEEISALLRVSLGTVKSRIARGREELKRRLNGALGPCAPKHAGGKS